LLENKHDIVSWAILIVATTVYSDRCVKLLAYFLKKKSMLGMSGAIPPIPTHLIARKEAVLLYLYSSSTV
jgi:hypothetical protein